MVFFIDEARSSPPPSLLTNVNEKMVFFIEVFPNILEIKHITGRAKKNDFNHHGVTLATSGIFF